MNANILNNVKMDAELREVSAAELETIEGGFWGVVIGLIAGEIVAGVKEGGSMNYILEAGKKLQEKK